MKGQYSCVRMNNTFVSLITVEFALDNHRFAIAIRTIIVTQDMYFDMCNEIPNVLPAWDCVSLPRVAVLILPSQSVFRYCDGSQ